jgi:hypothetical protein
VTTIIEKENGFDRAQAIKEPDPEIDNPGIEEPPGEHDDLDDEEDVLVDEDEDEDEDEEDEEDDAVDPDDQ